MSRIGNTDNDQANHLSLVVVVTTMLGGKDARKLYFKVMANLMLLASSEKCMHNVEPVVQSYRKRGTDASARRQINQATR